MLFNDQYLVESTKCDEEESYRLTHLTLQNLAVSLPYPCSLLPISPPPPPLSLSD